MIHPHASGRGRVGVLVWTAEYDDSWQTMTWTAATVISVGSLLAVFRLLPVSVHGPLHFSGFMNSGVASRR